MEELIDILDEFGNKEKRTLSANEVHKSGFWHRVIKVVVLNQNNEILIQRRSKTKKIFPNVWDIGVTGHVSAGEQPIASAQRELFEELGIKAKQNELKYIFSYKKDIGYNDFKEKMFIDLFYIKKDFNIADFSILKDEVSEIRFIELENFNQFLNDDYFIENFELEAIKEKLKGIIYDNQEGWI